MDRWLKDSGPLSDMLMLCGERVVTKVEAMWKAGRAGAGKEHQED